jgi:hypothetical protein
MVGTADGDTPGLRVAAVTAAARLLGDKEGDVVACMVSGVKAAGAENAAVVQRAVAVAGRQSQSHEEK